MRRISEDKLRWSISHLVQFGDTDIFPHPFELKFLKESINELADYFSKKDIDSITPMTVLESVVPKSKRGFRFAHQIYPVDNILFTAALVSIAPEIERVREASAGEQAFSYRFAGDDEFKFWQTSHNHRTWLEHQCSLLLFNMDPEDLSAKITHVVRTDISDFYSRLYHHRIEHHLEKIAGNAHCSRFLKKCLKHWRSRESFGLPVGGNPSRLLAELCLTDVDVELKTEDYNHSRYVDDYIIFVRKDQDPYDAIVFLATSLMQSERLTLNAAKTRIFTATEYLSMITPPGEGEDITLDGLVMLASDFADEEFVDLPYDFNTICCELLKEIEQPDWDIGKIRLLIKSLRAYEGKQVTDFFLINMGRLWAFIKEIVIEMTMLDDVEIDHRRWQKAIVGIHNHQRLKSLDLQRAWLLEFFSREIVKFDRDVLNWLTKYDDVLAQRQQFGLRYLLRDLAFFRRYRNRTDQVSSWVQPALLYYSRCLPKDEYSLWIDTYKKSLQFTAAEQFGDWCKKQI